MPPLQLLLVSEGADIVAYTRGAAGELAKQGVAATLPDDVSSLAVSPDRHKLFAVCGGTRVRTFSIDQTTGALGEVGTEAALTEGAAFASTDKSGRFLLTASLAIGHSAILANCLDVGETLLRYNRGGGV
jgi:6-phosphogluconolactonase (cycloisomerase 2 family)